jgi:hypothetical protein
MARPRRTLTLKLPDEFIELCWQDGVLPATVLRGFIADLCGITNYADDPRDDGYASHGSDERRAGGIAGCWTPACWPAAPDVAAGPADRAIDVPD